MKKILGLFSAALALVALPSVASAQEWLRDRRYTEGIGYRVGDFELHPGIAAEGGYDSNFFHRAPDIDPIAALHFRITPSLSFSTLTAQRREVVPGGSTPDFEFQSSLDATYNEFVPLNGTEADKSNMRHQRNVGANVNALLSIFPHRVWSSNVNASFGRVITASQDGLPSGSYNRDLPRAGVELVYTPGAGLFDWRLGYQFSGAFFESGQYSALDNIQNGIETRGRWRFLPRTAVFYDGRFDFISYPTGNAKTSSHPVRAQIGLNGLVTSSFALLASVGWGASFYSSDPADPAPHNFDSVIGQVELKWYITPNPSTDPAAAGLALSSVSVGFTRDFADSYIGTYYDRLRGYTSFSHFFANTFLLNIDGGAGPIIFPAIPKLQVNTSFTDIRIDATVFGEFRIKDQLGINLTGRYGQNISDTTVSDAALSTSKQELRWRQIEAYLGVRWFM